MAEKQIGPVMNMLTTAVGLIIGISLVALFPPLGLLLLGGLIALVLIGYAKNKDAD